MRIRPLSKDASQVNFSNSILKHFNAETFHDSYKPLDEILEKNKGRKIEDKWLLISLSGTKKVNSNSIFWGFEKDMILDNFMI